MLFGFAYADSWPWRLVEDLDLDFDTPSPVSLIIIRVPVDRYNAVDIAARAAAAGRQNPRSAPG